MNTRSTILFLCGVIIAQCRAEDLPISYRDYIQLCNGNFENMGQVNDGSHDRVEFLLKPVLIPALQQGYVLYGEELINGYLYRRSVIARNESSTDYTLDLTYYNFTDFGQYKLGTFNTDELANFTRDDFRLDQGCQEAYTQPFLGVLFGQASDCRHTVNGQHPAYTIYITCDNILVVPALASNETTSLLAYDLKHRGPRYPLINQPEGYVNPC
jgi:hypothetical protein